MNEHPNVTAYAQYSVLTTEERENIEEHLKVCGECRDRVLFIRKMNATLQREGRIDRVAKALGMSTEALKREMHLGTSITALIERPPDSPVTTQSFNPQPIAPVEK